MSAKNIVFLVLIVAAVFLGANSVYIVNEKQQAIVVRLSEPKETIREPGLQFKAPLIDRVIFIDKRVLSVDVPPQEVIASDQRRIQVDSFARFRIVDPLKAYQAAPSNTELSVNRLLARIMDTTVRDALAEEAMTNIVSKERAQLMDRISAATNQRAGTLGIEVIDVRLKRVDLPTQNSLAIYERMRSERKQEAELIRAEGREQATIITSNADREKAQIIADAERQSQEIRGQADANAARITVAAYKQDEEFFRFYRALEAYRKALKQGDTRLILSTDDPFFRQFFSGGDPVKDKK